MSTAFDRIVSQLDYPMLVVTAAAGGARGGCLVGFHTQCSLDPPRYLVCLSTRNRTSPLAARSEHLGVHVLDRDDHPLASLFGEQTGDTLDKFARCAWLEERGVPVLTGTRAWFVGRVLDRVSLGDHVGHVLEPVEAHVEGRLRQLPFQRVKTMRPGHP